MECSIIIVNYRTDAVLAECLRSLEATTDRSNVEIIVVDNSATLRAAGCEKSFPWARIIESAENLGFARACNVGLREARGRNLLLLNPDTEVHPGAVKRLSEHLDAHAEVGAVGPKLLDPDGSLQYSCRRFPGYATIFFGRYSLLTRLFPTNPVSRDYLYLDWDHGASREVDWVSGACLMVRRDVIDRVGALDEGYFLFVEDMDWCRRIRDAGLGVVYLPESVVTHRIGSSRGPVPPRVVWARHRGMLRYVRKHFKSPWPLRAAVAAGLTLRAGLEIVANGRQGTS